MNMVVQKKPELPAQMDQATSLIGMIERAATNPEIDMNKMERLWQMYKEESARQAEAKFNTAFAQMQSELPEIREGGQIRHDKKLISTYGRWDEDINPVIKPVLQKHGFAISFRIDTKEKITVEAVLCHEAGHCIRTSIVLPSDTSGSKNAVQAVASSVSYGKRYTAGALLNITTCGMDDDGQAAGKAATITDEQAMTMQALQEDVGADKQKFFSYLTTKCKTEIKAFKDIPAVHYASAITALEGQRKKA